MNDTDWRINYANGLLQKLEAVKAKCGGGLIHDVSERIGSVNFRIMCLERSPTEQNLANFDKVIQDVERFLGTIIVPDTGTQTRMNIQKGLWRQA